MANRYWCYFTLGVSIFIACTLDNWGTKRVYADVFHYVDANGVIHFTNSPSKSNPWKLYARSNDTSKKIPVVPNGVTPRPSMTGGTERASRYDSIIREAAAYYQIPEALVRAVIKVESNYEPTAFSRAGAQGLMQLLGETAARMMVRDVWDPRENIFGGCRLLRVLANTFNGDLDLTIAAYNAGPGAVVRAGGIPNIAETRDYVIKVKNWYRQYRMSRDGSDAYTP